MFPLLWADHLQLSNITKVAFTHITSWQISRSLWIWTHTLVVVRSIYTAITWVFFFFPIWNAKSKQDVLKVSGFWKKKYYKMLLNCSFACFSSFHIHFEVQINDETTRISWLSKYWVDKISSISGWRTATTDHYEAFKNSSRVMVIVEDDAAVEKSTRTFRCCSLRIFFKS